MQKEKLNYVSSLFSYKRRVSSAVKVGVIEIGGDNPIRIQSMANTDTNDIVPSVEQALRIEAAGGELVRFSAQGVKEANSLELIHQEYRKRGGKAPLVADIHFNPQAAMVAAANVEKVRINPGNFVDRVHTLQRFDYTDDEYRLEIEKIKEKLYPLLDICKAHGTAIRIGVNHGSLSDRILSRYGDTPQGMVESCMEFLRLCRDYDFMNVVISIKASNTVIMVQTVRLLVATMNIEGMQFPLHLGVTEAGDGEDGRVKSAVGIGALLADGIGDTIRVSLSEDPECEVPVARKLVDYISKSKDSVVDAEDSYMVNPFEYHRRETRAVGCVGAQNPPVVVANASDDLATLKADFCAEAIRCLNVDNYSSRNQSEKIHFLLVKWSQYDKMKQLNLDSNTILVVEPDQVFGIGEQRAFIHRLLKDGINLPVILKRTYQDKNLEDLQIKAAADMGQFFLDGLADGIWICDDCIDQKDLNSLMFGILQGARARVTKTEYISCPSCGRTLFNLQQVIAKIKSRTSHLKGLKIGIMGCIVNGPGEMADADYGYVGSGRGKVNLYKGQTCVEKMIPEEEAVDKLIQLIKDNGDWSEE